MMNNRQRHILAQQISQALAHRKRFISIHLTSALLEMEEAHLHRLEDEGLFPTHIRRADSSRSYDLEEVYKWLKDTTHDLR